MSNSENTEEIDLRQLLNFTKRVLKKMLVGFFNLIHFLKSNAFLIVGLLIVGVLGGMAWDHFLGHKNYAQEIVVEPNYNSTGYLYSYVEQSNAKIEQSSFIGEEKYLKKIARIEIEPIADVSDIFDFYKELGSESGLADALENFDSKNIENSKYTNQFRFHKIRFFLDKKTIETENFSRTFFDDAKTNIYFSTQHKIKQDELRNNIAENEKSVLFINEFIAKISDNKLSNSKSEVVVFGNEQEIPTVTSLIKEKNILIEKIAEDKEAFQMSQNLFNIVQAGEILEVRNFLSNKKFLFSILLVSCFLMFSLFKFLYRRSQSFVNN